MMKNLLIGTASAALLISAGVASAADYKGNGNQWNATIGGAFKVGAAYVDSAQKDSDGFPLIRDAELKITFEMIADNGLTFGVYTEIEAGADAGEFDESNLYVEGSFGRVEIGEQDGAGDKFMGSGVVGCEFVSAADACGILFDYHEGNGEASGTKFSVKGGDTGDSLKVTYYTPNFSGFKAGVSIVPEVDNEGNGGNSTSITEEDLGVEVGAQYKGDFGGFGLTVGGGWVNRTTGAPGDNSAAAGGVAVSFSGFKVGVNYGWRESDDLSTLALSSSYGTGPWTFGLSGALNLDGDKASDGDWGLAGEVAYALAPGVSVGTGLEYTDPEESNLDGAFAASVWMGLSF